MTEIHYGLDIGTTSVGWAVIQVDRNGDPISLLDCGVRIFPETLDAKKRTPLNLDRRNARMMRRQIRRRRERRKGLGKLLQKHGFLPPFIEFKKKGENESEWAKLMTCDPYPLRVQAIKGEKLDPYQLGRVLYHLNQQRHFLGKDEMAEDNTNTDAEKDDKAAMDSIDETRERMRAHGFKTLGEYLAAIPSDATKDSKLTPKKWHCMITFAHNEIKLAFAGLTKALQNEKAVPDDMFSDVEIIKGDVLHHIDNLKNESRHARRTLIDTLFDTLTEGETLLPELNDIAEKQGVGRKTEDACKAIRSTVEKYLNILQGRDHERRRGIHAKRENVIEEFDAIIDAQGQHHPTLSAVRDDLYNTIFFQRPVFWRTSTLDQCRYFPNKPAMPIYSWLAEQKRMLEELNNLTITSRNNRPLYDAEREAVLNKLQKQKTMTWGGLRRELEGVADDSGENWHTKGLKFNLEEIKNKKGLEGNAVEVDLRKALGDDFMDTDPRAQDLCESIHDYLFEIHTHKTPDNKRVVLQRDKEKAANKERIKSDLMKDFDFLTHEQADKLIEIKPKSGWVAFSEKAIRILLPKLEAGIKMGTLANSLDEKWVQWRRENDLTADISDGEVFDTLPSPKNKDEQDRLKKIRNPSVVRIQNEVRKVVNNLIREHGKPKKIRLELGRDTGLSNKDISEINKAQTVNQKKRDAAAAELEKNNKEINRDNIERYMLWRECGGICPYSGEKIGFNNLWGSEFQVEHIWPRSKSHDDSFKNKTLCRKDKNMEKGNRTPYEAFGQQTDEWERMKQRMKEHHEAADSLWRMSKGKYKRFISEQPMDDDFAERQLNDMRYASRQMLEQLDKLYGGTAREKGMQLRVIPVNGAITSDLRHYWGLDSVLPPGKGKIPLYKMQVSDETGKLFTKEVTKKELEIELDKISDSEKREKKKEEVEKSKMTRQDHRHHAVDAITIACTTQSMIQRLTTARKEQEADKDGKKRIEDRKIHNIPPPWSGFRHNVEQAIDKIIVSHRTRRKISGKLHEETIYGDIGKSNKKGYNNYVTRKVLASATDAQIQKIRDQKVKEIVQESKNKESPPRRSCYGPQIKKVRILENKEPEKMAKLPKGYAPYGNNHHIALFRKPDGTGGYKYDSEIVTMFEAVSRLKKCVPVIQRNKLGWEFVMSLSAGEAIEWKGERWVLTIITSQVTVKKLNDASKEGKKTKVSPMATTLAKDNARKILIDPIGGVHPARD